MKRKTATWVLKAEEDWEGACELAAREPPLRDAACFDCQQSAEKYLKALMQEKGAVAPRTHDLEDFSICFCRSMARCRRFGEVWRR